MAATIPHLPDLCHPAHLPIPSHKTCRPHELSLQAMGRAVVFSPSFRFRRGRRAARQTPACKVHQFLGQVFGVPSEIRALDKFRLRTTLLSRKDKKKVREWFCFAVERGAKELDISVQYKKKGKEFRLASTFRNAKSIVTLKLENLTLADNGKPISLPSLETLSLRKVRLNPSSLTALISGCPCIQHLSFYDFDELSMRTLLNAKPIVVLNLENVTIEDSGQPISLPSLQTPSLRDVKLTASSLSALISGCPCIQCVSLLTSSFSLHYYNISMQTLLDAKSLTSLKIECARIWGDNNDDPISLPSLKTLFLRKVTFEQYFSLSSLISRCPCIQYLYLTGYYHPYYELSIQTLLDAKSLTSLSLERVKVPGDDNNDRKAIGLLSLKTMSLKEVILDDMTFRHLRSGSPCLEHLSVSLSYEHIHIPRSSIKSLQVRNIHSTVLRVSRAKNLESFTLISECTTQIESTRLDCCKSLKYLNIRAPHLQEFTPKFNGRKDRVKATHIPTLDYPIINFLEEESPGHGNIFLQ